MRIYSHTEPGRRILAWSGLTATLVFYGGSFVEEYQRTGALTVWWPPALFWTVIVAAAARVLLGPRNWADLDAGSRRVAIYRDGAMSRKIPLGELAPLEVAEQVSDRGSSNFTVWHVVRSKPRVRVNSNCSEGWHGVHLIQSTRCAPARRRGPACDSEGRRCPSRR